ncbi:unnamed protein product [Paramecium octaurelia]|uniref:Protein kinase domain containing protein n=1 Tax=Paramecium octaurelia TaxID=43137 RepID=A0A8S1XMH8_PAROT|nr:unnamed protein product [Paramecium octaurelia]
MGSCIAKKQKEEVHSRNTSKLKVIIPKNQMLESNPVYAEMPFDQGDCFQLNKNLFKDEYIIIDSHPFLSTDYGIYQWCYSKKTDSRKLVKTIKKTEDPKSDEPVLILKNIHMMQYLDHPNIAKMVEYFNESLYYYIVYEDYEGGNLLSRMITRGENPEQMAAIIIEQVLSTLFYLHSKNIIYRFLNHNALLCDDKLNVTFVEFGAAKKISQYIQLPVGDQHYQSPEMLNGNYSFKSDIWSVGVLLHFLLSGAMPFDGVMASSIKNSIMRGIVKLEDTFDWDKIPDAKEFVRKLLNFSQNQRPTAADALKDRWIEKAKLKKLALKINPALTNLRKFQKCEVLVEAIIMQIVQMTLTQEQKGEILQIFQEFDSNRDGKISTQELIEGYKKYQTSTKLEDQDIEKLVKKIDSNGNGYLDYTEFLLACQDKKKLLTVEKLKLVFAQLDVDKDNALSMMEMRRIFGGNRISDKNWHNILSKTNLQQKSVLTEQEFLEFIIKTMQNDHSFQ